MGTQRLGPQRLARGPAEEGGRGIADLAREGAPQPQLPPRAGGGGDSASARSLEPLRSGERVRRPRRRGDGECAWPGAPLRPEEEAAGRRQVSPRAEALRGTCLPAPHAAWVPRGHLPSKARRNTRRNRPLFSWYCGARCLYYEA